MKRRNILVLVLFVLAVFSVSVPSLFYNISDSDVQPQLPYQQLSPTTIPQSNHTRIAITYADRGYNRSSIRNCYTAKTVGGFDGCMIWRRHMLDSQFVNENRGTLDQSRGAGFWLWKPYIILKTLHSVKDGDYVMYADAGSYYVADVDPLTRLMEKEKQDILLFRLKYFERTWTKRDTFILSGTINE